MQFEFDSTVVREIQQLSGGDEATTNDLEELMKALNTNGETVVMGKKAGGFSEMRYEERERVVSTTRVTKKKKKKKRRKKKGGGVGEEEWEVIEYEEEISGDEGLTVKSEVLI